MSKPLKIKHHYRPIEHLKAFAANDGKLWVYDRNGTPPFRQIPKNIGFEKFLYAPNSGPNPKDDAMEDWLERYIDTPSVRPLRSLLSGANLSATERLRMARFLGMQDMRTPRARDYLLESYQAHLDHWYATWTENLPRLQQSIYHSYGTLYRVEELRRLVAEHHPEAEKAAWLEFIQNSVLYAAERIIKMRWQLVDIPDGLELLTSDLGIVKFVDGFEQPCTWRFGFSLGATHWFVPLGRKKGLALIPPLDQRPFEVTRGIVKRLNKRLVLDSWRFVFSTNEHAFIEKWWAQPNSRTNHFIIPPG